MPDLLCCCGHPGQLHVPGGGPCTAGSGGCDCRAFVRRTRLADEHLVAGAERGDE